MKRTPTRRRLTLIFSAVLAVLLLCELLLVVPLVRTRELELSVATQTAIALGVGNSLSNDLKIVRTKLQTIAVRDEFRQMDALAIEIVSEGLVGESQRLGSMLVVDTEGTVIAGTPGNLLVDWANHSLEGESFSVPLEEGDLFFSEPFYDSASGSVYAQISVPIDNATGERVGVLVGGMTVNSHIEYVRNYPVSKDMVLRIVTPGGIVLAQSGLDTFAREKGPLSLSSAHLPQAQQIVTGEEAELGEHIHDDETGRFKQSHCVVVDITEQKRSDVALRHRAHQLETVADAGRRISAILDLDELLVSVAGAIRERFDSYHVDLMLVDEAREYAVFWAGSNPADSETWLKRGDTLCRRQGGDDRLGSPYRRNIDCRRRLPRSSLPAR